ncbi:MAG: DNA mismatch repair endonuclease MutL [Acidobacteria bacterium]|nr:DNA mismatch repair endonuclease MutL [Acidobacteriota bacterium]
MTRVRILPASEAQRIAAGEVVERPGSVIRELVENALDAGGQRIRVDIHGGGLVRMRVADDGSGMTPADAHLALERHATSKIACLEDLSRVTTLGFRGEALPSIASVSRLTLETAAGEDGEAVRLVVEGGISGPEQPASRPRGTTVTVEDLFFNTPARRKFLKKPASEFTRISDALLPEMLARPEVGFYLSHEERVSVDLAPAADLRERIAGLWGVRLAGSLIPIQRQAAGMTVHGLVSGPDETRGSRRGWHLFVNGRPVRDSLLIHAAGEGVAGLLPKGRYPVLFLFLDLPGGDVDVNVHPAKSEVRFADRSAVFTLVRSTLRQALAPAGFLARGAGVAPQETDGHATDSWAVSEGYRAVSGNGPDQQSVVLGQQTPSGTAAMFHGDLRHSRESAAAVSSSPQAAADREAATPVVIAQYRDCFIVAHDADALYLLDQHAAHERVLYEEILANFAAHESPRQALLFPLSMEVDPGHGSQIPALLPALENLGFGLEAFGEDTLLVRQVPARLPEARAVEALRDLLPILLKGETGADRAARHRLEHKIAATMACHAAVRFHDSLTRERMTEIVRLWLLCREPLTCPHGRTAVVRWPHDQLLRAFGRP